MKLSHYKVNAAINDYYTVVSGIRAAVPEALKDPIIAAAVAQFEVAELAIKARLDQLVDILDEDE